MKNNSFYDLRDVSFSDRETFNNIILLLTMVKSEAYYIIGFSRPHKNIKIGFDFTDSFNSVITHMINIDLNVPDFLRFKCTFDNINSDKFNISIPDKFKNMFFYENDNIVYERFFERDQIIPVSIDNMDRVIGVVKKDIILFTEYCLNYK